MKEYRITILGLDCPNCSAKLERVLSKSKMFENVNLSFVTKTLTLNSEHSFDEVKEEINRIIAKVEPDAYINENNYEHHDNEHKHYHEEECCCGHSHHLHHGKEECECEQHQNYHEQHHEHSHHHVKQENHKKDIILMVSSLILLLVGLVIENVFGQQRIYVSLFILGYLCVSYDILYKSYKNIKRGQVFDENFLMAIASIGALCLQEYHEAILVIFLYKVGELFQDYAVNNSHKSIKNLLEMQPKTSNLVFNNEVIEVDSKSVQIDDVIIVKVGERVPLDGVIIEGSSSFDTSSISGESKPMDLYINNEVSSGYINMSSLVKIRVTRTYENSSINKMLKLIEESQDKKSNNEKFISKFAKYYTPIVVVIALILVIVPSIFHHILPNIIKDGFTSWLYKGLVFLVISCPCALVISVPLSFFSGVGRASRSGILVKGSNYLEKMSKIDTVVLDKTGTITKGNFVINKIITNNCSERELLEIAYYCDYYSTHPIALAIKEKNKNSSIDINRIKSSDNLAGLGVKSIIDSNIVLVGNEKLMKENNINYKEVDEIGTIVYIAMNNEYLGALVITDELKLGAKESIDNIHNLGIKTLLLSGDNNEIVSNVCSKVGIINYKAELSPIDKVDELKQVINNKTGNIIYVGDGVNDAPSLVTADVGISMGGLGSDAAIESSDIVINDDSIYKVNDLIKISKKTTKIVKQNIVFSISVKVLIMILTIIGLSDMLLGIFADVGVMILAVLNSLRILAKKI